MVGGRLVINNPEKSRDAGKYVCVVSNIFGTVRSSEATLSFGCKLMFMLKHRNVAVSLKCPVLTLLCLLLACVIAVLLCKNSIFSALVCRDQQKISFVSILYPLAFS